MPKTFKRPCQCSLDSNTSYICIIEISLGLTYICIHKSSSDVSHSHRITIISTTTCLLDRFPFTSQECTPGTTPPLLPALPTHQHLAILASSSLPRTPLNTLFSTSVWSSPSSRPYCFSSRSHHIPKRSTHPTPTPSPKTVAHPSCVKNGISSPSYPH